VTMVAAFKVKGTPVLIGDMAVTIGSTRSLRKKAYFIAPNLVIAWAGHMIVAKTVIAALKTTFSVGAVTKQALEQHLTGYHSDDFGQLHTNFIGWIVDEGFHCFLWNCLYPQQVFYQNQYFEGTGEKYFASMQQESRDWQTGETGLPPDSSLVISAINEIARARFEESLYRETWDLSFGASYDILVFLSGEFRYIGSIVYLGWDYHWDSFRATGKLEHAPVVIKHNCMGEYSILQEALQGNSYNRNITNYLSRPVYDDMKGADLSKFQLTFDGKSDFFANYFLFRENGKVVFKVLLTLQQASGDGPLKIERRRDGACFFDFDTDELNRMYQQHKSLVSP
jgi:hypothetical protein